MGKFKVCFIKDRNYIQQSLDGEFVKKNNVKRQQEYDNLILFQLKDGN